MKTPKPNKRVERTQAKLDAWRSGTADQPLVARQTDSNGPTSDLSTTIAELYESVLASSDGPSAAALLARVKQVANSAIAGTDERIQAWNAIRRVERFYEQGREANASNKNGIEWELRRLTVPLVVTPIDEALPEIHYEARYSAEHDDWIARIVVREVKAERVSNAIKWCNSMSPARKQKALSWIETEAHVIINREAV